MERGNKGLCEGDGGFLPDKTILPRQLVWEDGRVFAIDRVKDIRPAASLKAGAQDCGISASLGEGDLSLSGGRKRLVCGATAQELRKISVPGSASCGIMAHSEKQAKNQRHRSEFRGKRRPIPRGDIMASKIDFTHPHHRLRRHIYPLGAGGAGQSRGIGGPGHHRPRHHGGRAGGPAAGAALGGAGAGWD